MKKPNKIINAIQEEIWKQDLKPRALVEETGLSIDKPASRILLKRGIDRNYVEFTKEFAGIKGKLQILKH